MIERVLSKEIKKGFLKRDTRKRVLLELLPQSNLLKNLLNIWPKYDLYFILEFLARCEIIKDSVLRRGWTGRRLH